MQVLGIIPARGGSKGIPHKNRKFLNGKPLLQYTIESALQAKELDRLIFSSEDDALIELAKSFGVEVPFKRPQELAQDTSGSIEVVKHALEVLSEKGEEYGAICLLQVTNPFRTSLQIDTAITSFKENKYDTLLSVLEVPHEYNPHWVFKNKTPDTLQLVTGENAIIKRRQDLPKAFIRDGAIYLTKTSIILEEDSFYGKRIGYSISDKKRHVNIDTMQDWEKAEAIANSLPIK